MRPPVLNQVLRTPHRQTWRLTPRMRCLLLRWCRLQVACHLSPLVSKLSYYRITRIYTEMNILIDFGVLCRISDQRENHWRPSGCPGYHQKLPGEICSILSPYSRISVIYGLHILFRSTHGYPGYCLVHSLCKCGDTNVDRIGLDNILQGCIIHDYLTYSRNHC